MKEKLVLQDIVDALAKSTSLSKKEADTFYREFFAAIIDNMFNNEPVKIKDFGTFKLVSVESRKSVDVNTGAEIEIPAHHKISFIPDRSLKDLVNKPFANFVIMPIDENISFDEVEESPEPAELPDDEIDTAIDEIEIPVDRVKAPTLPKPEADDVKPVEKQGQPIQPAPQPIYVYTTPSSETKDEDSSSITLVVPTEKVVIEKPLPKPETPEYKPVEKPVEPVVQPAQAPEPVQPVQPAQPVQQPQTTPTVQIPTPPVIPEIDAIPDEEINANVSVQKKLDQLKGAIDALSGVKKPVTGYASTVGESANKDADGETSEYPYAANPVTGTGLNSRQENEEDITSIVGVPPEENPSHEYYDYYKQTLATRIRLKLLSVAGFIILLIAALGVSIYYMMQETTITDKQYKHRVVAVGDSLKKDSADIVTDTLVKPKIEESQAVESVSSKPAEPLPEQAETTQSDTDAAERIDEEAAKKPKTISENLKIDVPGKASFMQNWQYETGEDDISAAASGNAGAQVEVIKKGASLLSIAQEHYRNRVFWVYIYEENKDKIPNYDNISAGMEVVIPNPKKYGINPDDPKSVRKAKELETTILRGGRK
jgi:nucleoid DNA-binding protein